MTRRFTGKHMTIILVVFFGTVMTVNFTMAYFASSTFSGTVVDNSYVASQKFNGWLQQAREQKALDWNVAIVRGGDGRLEAELTRAGTPMTDARIFGVARHPIGREPERPISFRSLGEGRYQGLETLPVGRWIIQVEIRSDGSTAREIFDLK